jgi:HK97 gp10 family phage protein
MVTLRGKSTKVVPSNYVHLVEFGTRPHSLGKGARAKRKASKWGRERAAKPAKAGAAGNKHPGAKAKPFLRPAMRAAKKEAGQVALERLGKEIQKEIERQAKRLASKGAK